jgi:hypothetical protein
MPASSALFTGSVKARASVTATAIPFAFADTAALVALTISATTAFCDPVHW